MNTVHYFETNIRNVGDIDLEFELIQSPNPWCSKFKFHPESGRLKVGEEQKIEIEFAPTSLGDFEALFDWDIKVNAHRNDSFAECSKRDSIEVQRVNTGTHF